MNLTGAGLLGVKRSLLIDQPFHMWLAPEFWEAFRAHLQKVFGTGGRQTCELKLLRPDGAHLQVLMESTRQPDAQEAQGQCHSMISDISDRKQAEKELHLKERLLDDASDSIFLHDLDGRFLYLNEAACRDRGYEREELRGKDIWALIAPDYAATREKILQDLLAKGEIIFESAHIRKDGSVMPLEIHARIIDLEDRRLILSVARDITERKEAEAALRESEALYRSLFENMLNGFAYCKMLFEQDQPQDFIYLDVNRSFETLTGLKNVVGKRVSEVIPGLRESDPELLEIYDRVAMTGKPERFEIYLKALQVWFSISVYSPAKEYFVSVFDVITERKLAEEELRGAAQKWCTTFDAIGDAICLLDAAAKILTCNQAMADLVGRPIPELIGRPCCDLVHGPAGPIAGCPLVRLKQSGKREAVTLPFGDRWFHVTVDPILNEAGEVTGAVHIFADITEHRRALKQIRNLNVILTAIKDVNETLLRTKSEPELFQQICDLMLRIPNNCFTWIGLVQPDSFEVKPVAWAGYEDGYLSDIKVTWDDSPYGQGPIGTAIKTGQPGITADIENDPKFRPWRQQALQRGYASCIAFPLIHAGITMGSLNVYAEKKNAFGSEETEFLNQVAGDIAVGVKSLRLEQELVQNLIKLQKMMIQTIEAIAAMAELRDPYTASHQQRVARLTLALAQEMGLAPDCTEGLRVASLIHDIGKIVVPAEILNKPGKISDYEMNMIKTHSQAGYEIVNKIDFPWPVAQIVLQHHERLNGSGYPQGLREPDILQEAKILAVADVVEAMASHRPYRPGLGIDKALAEISKNRGVLYDPETVDCCVRLFTEKGFQFD